MQRWRNKLLLLGGVAAVGLAIPALGQDVPQSILPPGFNQTEPAPLPPPPVATPTPAPRAAPPPRSQPMLSETTITDSARDDLEELLAQLPPPIEIPDRARRSTQVVGPLGPGNWGLGEGAFGGANGRFLSTLLRRTDAPLPSRWASILLRRALLSRVPAPSLVNPVDWVAERAWLLVRMGEADAARMLVQAVDVDQFTPKMFAVAVQTALATADPAALCPLVGPGRETSTEAVWPLAEAMCAALEGEASRASALIDQARRRGQAGGIDLLLAEKIVGAGSNTRRAVTIQWDDVEGLNSWRFGLAAAAGADIPQRLMAGAGANVRAWHARAPMVPLDQRAASADAAASLGVFSNASLVEMYSLLADNADVTEIAGSVGGRLRTAYVGRNPAARLAAIKDLWDDADNEEQRHARSILTAVAAAQLEPDAEYAADAPDLIASMLSAGMDRYAIRWASVVDDMEAGRRRDQATALLALAMPRADADGGADIVESFEESDDSAGKYRTRLLFAALAGLGRIDESSQTSLARSLRVPIGRRNQWTAMIDAAANARQPGTVALLAAAAMQTPNWRGVPPEHLYRIVRALRQVGLEYEARMIAAEALSRR